jgi:hypothetical protein
MQNLMVGLVDVQKLHAHLAQENLTLIHAIKNKQTNKHFTLNVLEHISSRPLQSIYDSTITHIL